MTSGLRVLLVDGTDELARQLEPELAACSDVAIHVESVAGGAALARALDALHGQRGVLTRQQRMPAKGRLGALPARRVVPASRFVRLDHERPATAVHAVVVEVVRLDADGVLVVQDVDGDLTAWRVQ